MGRILKLLFKTLGGVLIVAIVGLYVLVNHSAVQRDLTCSGHWRDEPEKKETAYVQLNEYRWWVKLWAASNSAGDAKVQTDKRALSEYISHVTRIHDGRLALYMFNDYDYTRREVGKFRGGYRAANKEITVEFMPTAVFIGICDGWA